MKLIIVTGGQTGVDRAALDAARQTGIPFQGFCPEGRLAEDGVIPTHYPLTEIPMGGYADRTRKNVEVSDLVLVFGEPDTGTQVAIEYAATLDRPVLQIHAGTKLIDAYREVLAYRKTEHGYLTVNITGPRESNAPGIYDQCRAYLEGLFGLLADEGV